LSDLFGGGSGFWSFIPSVSLSIFDGGSGKAQVRLAEASNWVTLYRVLGGGWQS